MSKNPRITYLILSSLIALLVVIVSLTGILKPELYSRESLNWKTQSIGQDKVDLVLLVPLLIITAILVYFQKSKFILIWAGVILYLIYTFIIYCFAVHFNQLYPVYCLILGLCFYSYIYFLFNQPSYGSFRFDKWTKATGVYFIIISIAFYLLWLSDILSAVANDEIPAILNSTNLPVNPVHSIDLALLLPALFIIGVNLLRRNSYAFLMAPIILVFFIIMNLTIAFLALELEKQGEGSGQILAIMMFGLAAISFGLLFILLKKSWQH